MQGVAIKSVDKLTRSKKLIRVCHEHYLRDDIASGTSLIEVDDENISSPLSKEPFNSTYLVLDANVFLHHMDLLEISCPGFCDVIVLHTVMAEVYHRDLGLYKRLLALIADQKRRFYVFANENNRASFDEQKGGETPNDYNDRLIRLATKWYADRLSGTSVRVLLITNDRDNERKAKSESLNVSSLETYVKDLSKTFPDMNLQDHVSSSSTTSRSNGVKQKRKTIYPVHWSAERLKREVSSKKAFRGTYRQNQYNRNEGRVTVHVSNEERTYVLRGQSSINRAIDGDIVVVVIEDEKKSDDDITARVVGILKRNWRNYCGTLLEDDMVGGRFY